MKGPSRDFRSLFRVGAVGGLPDEELLERFAADRDEAVFEAILGRHGPMVWGVCRRILRDPDAAEDAFQATFLVLVRKAPSIARRRLLAGWLYAVAYRTAVRARAMASRRRARERQVAELPEPEAAADDRRDDLPAILDEELRRLPAPYRIAVVLCDLEGMTQKEAAGQLGCPAGTVSSRLTRGRALLAERLARRGVALSIGSMAMALAREAASAPPTGLIDATARAAVLFATGGSAAVTSAEVGVLTREVLKTMVIMSRLKVAVPLLLMLALSGPGLIRAGAGAVGAGRQDEDEAATPARVPPAEAEAPAPPKWAHLTSDAGFESWVRLEDGRSLWKAEEYAGVHDPASGTQLDYRGDGPIVRRPDIVGVEDDGSLDVGFALDRAGVGPLDPDEMRRRMTEEGSRVVGGNFRSEAEIVELDGGLCLRIDTSRPDALGRLRLSEQTWYDVETRRPVRRRKLLQVADQHRYGREFRTTTIAYVDDGPADIYALGVPAGTPIVDAATLNRTEVPPALRRILDGAARGIERLPRSLRIVEVLDYGLQLTYWSAPEGYLEAQAAFVRDHNDRRIYGAGTPLSFVADHQPSSDLPPALRTRPGDDRWADEVAAWLPVDRSVNVHLNDGAKCYDLTRLIVAADRPRQARVHVLDGESFNDLPRPIRETWGYAFDNRRNLEVVPAEPGTPEGWVAIRVEYPEIRELYYADPEHDYAVARMVEWSDQDGGRLKFRTGSRAVRWARLPGGTWYVTEWERLHHLDQFDATGAPAAEQQSDYTRAARVVLTPMDPEAFPAGIFDGERFLDAAREEGATIEVD